MIEKNIKGSIIIGIAIIIAGLIAGGAIYSQKNNPPPKEEIDVRPTDFKKVAEASDKIKADDLEGATKLLVESYNERLQIVLKNRQTSKRLLKVYEDSLEAIERDEKLLARYLFEIGGIKIKQNKYAEANAYYTEANRLNSENSVYLNGLGLTCKLLGNFDEALEHYNTALDLDQKAYGENTDVARDINNIGGIWDAKGDYKKALEYYERAEAILLKSVGNKHPFMELVKGNIKSTREQLNTSTKEKPEKKQDSFSHFDHPNCLLVISRIKIFIRHRNRAKGGQMIISRLKLKNWRNFREIDVSLRPRQFIVGPNACGKSNLLDVFRFLRDIVKQEGGGLQKAVKERGGISKIRSLSAKNDPEIGIDISFADNPDSETTWRYSISIKQEPRGYRRTLLTSEKIWKGREPILDRPNKEDKKDPERLKQTYLEQVNSNQEFREISKYLDEVTYIHLVPQLLRYADSFQGDNSESDPFGQGFLTRVAKSNTRTQKARLSKIEKALKIAVPQFKELKFERDLDTGKPHLKAMYSHWRHKAGWQREDQFSDGTLRLIGLLWALLEGDSLLLLEEPELSLHSVIVSELSSQIYRMQKKSKRQVLISTHSADILSDDGIDGREVLMITPKNEGSKASIMSDINDVKELLSNGFTVGEIVSSKNNASKQQKFHQSSLFQ